MSGEALIATEMLGEGTEIPCCPGIKEGLLFCLEARCCIYIIFIRGDGIFNHCLQLDEPRCIRTACPQLIFPMLNMFL